MKICMGDHRSSGVLVYESRDAGGKFCVHKRLGQIKTEELEEPGVWEFEWMGTWTHPHLE